MLLSQIIFLFIYLNKRLKSLRYFLLTFNKIDNNIRKSFPPPKYINNNSNINQFENNKIFDYKKSSKYLKNKLRENINNKKNENNTIMRMNLIMEVI